MQIERASFLEGNLICRASYDGKLGVLLGRDLTNVWGKWGKMGKIIARAKFHIAWYRFYVMAEKDKASLYTVRLFQNQTRVVRSKMHSKIDI